MCKRWPTTVLANLQREEERVIEEEARVAACQACQVWGCLSCHQWAWACHQWEWAWACLLWVAPLVVVVEIEVVIAGTEVGVAGIEAEVGAGIDLASEEEAQVADEKETGATVVNARESRVVRGAGTEDDGRGVVHLLRKTAALVIFGA